MRTMLILLLLLLPVGAMAEITPRHSDFDTRLRLIDYNPLDVTKITTFYGVSTFVQFAESETIQDVAVGDDLAWNIIPRGSNLFIKPKAKKADTNVTVVTNKRVYHFALTVVPRSTKDASAWRDPDLTYGLTFRYPDEEAAKREELVRQEEIRKRSESVKHKLNMSTKVSSEEGLETTETSVPTKKTRDEAGQNYDYWVAGSEGVSPTAARDDGRFTYLEFTNNRDMPAVYTVNGEGKESLINTHVEGNTIVIQRVVPKLMLRKGAQVACIRNNAFDWDGGKDNSLGTIAPDVERTVREPR